MQFLELTNTSLKLWFELTTWSCYMLQNKPKKKHPVVVGGWGYTINQSKIPMSILGPPFLEGWAITLAF